MTRGCLRARSPKFVVVWAPPNPASLSTAAGDYVYLAITPYGPINPLDPARAHQITALDGSTDVLISLDASHAILFEHLTLAQLPAASFHVY